MDMTAVRTERKRALAQNTAKARNAAIALAAVALLASCGRNAPEEGATTLEASISPSSSAAVVTTLPPPTTTPPTTTPEYIVQQGDSLSIIAQRFGVSTEDLANFNGISDPDSIQVGQTLTIPPATTPSSETTTTTVAGG
jgi:LysM repeat protein